MAGPNVTINFSHLYHKQITIKGQPGYHPPDVPKCFAAAAEGKSGADRAGPAAVAGGGGAPADGIGDCTGKIVLDPTLG